MTAGDQSKRVIGHPGAKFGGRMGPKTGKRAKGSFCAARAKGYGCLEARGERSRRVQGCGFVGVPARASRSNRLASVGRLWVELYYGFRRMLLRGPRVWRQGSVIERCVIYCRSGRGVLAKHPIDKTVSNL